MQEACIDGGIVETILLVVKKTKCKFDPPCVLLESGAHVLQTVFDIRRRTYIRTGRLSSGEDDGSTQVPSMHTYPWRQASQKMHLFESDS
jgi:hypothetical protein